jgi:hypothetical protein
MQEAIEAWEGEGGALRQTTEEAVVPRLVFSRGSPVATEKMMIGTANQVDWFDRVATALEGATGKQPEQKRTETSAVIAILKTSRPRSWPKIRPAISSASGRSCAIRCGT